MSYGQAPFGLREVTVVAAGSTVAVPVAQKFTITERVKSGELAGDDVTKAIVAFTDALTFSIQSGGISLEAYCEMTGRTLATSGTTPNETKTMTATAAESFPYFKIYGRSLGDAGDNIHVVVFKAKLTSIEGRFADGQFMVSSASGVAIDDGTNGVFDIVQNETAAALPTT